MCNNVLAIDVSLSGISGDMFLAGLLELYSKDHNVDEIISYFLKEINSELLNPVEIKSNQISYHDFHGRLLSMKNNDKKIKIKEIRILMNKLFDNLNIRGVYRKIADNIFDIMVDAEKIVHNTDHVHLHELGTIDTVIDIAFSVFLLDKLQICSVVTSPVALGQGIVDTQHGKLPVPAPATLAIMQKYNIPSIPGPLGGEATTPTGMAIISSLNKNLEKSSTAVWKHNGLGFGQKKWQDRGNYLRLRLGEKTNTSSDISILETNIDDVDGELLGYAVDKLMSAGALDISYYPIFMKKNRPAYCMRVIVKRSDTDKISDMIQEHTGTLGVRVIDINRHIGARTITKENSMINDLKVEFSIKRGKYSYKIEFEDLKRISEQLDIPVIKLRNMLMREVEL